jgi:hypothetical protein
LLLTQRIKKGSCGLLSNAAKVRQNIFMSPAQKVRLYFQKCCLLFLEESAVSEAGMCGFSDIFGIQIPRKITEAVKVRPSDISRILIFCSPHQSALVLSVFPSWPVLVLPVFPSRPVLVLPVASFGQF